MNLALWVLLLLGHDRVLVTGLGHDSFRARELAESCLVAKYIGLGWLGDNLAVGLVHPDPEVRWRLHRAQRRIREYLHRSEHGEETEASGR